MTSLKKDRAKKYIIQIDDFFGGVGDLVKQYIGQKDDMINKYWNTNKYSISLKIW